MNLIVIFSVFCLVRFDLILYYKVFHSFFLAGHPGARNCKFLERVTITDQACKGDSNWKQYAVHAQDVPVRKIAEFNLHKPELMADPPVQEMPVQSLITTPSPNDIISAIKSGCESISVKGNLSSTLLFYQIEPLKIWVTLISPFGIAK